MWKAIYDSVQGTSHQSAEIPCQDACCVASLTDPHEMFIAICADGAGSAQHSERGAKAVCKLFIQFLQQAPPDSFSDPQATANSIVEVCSKIRTEIESIATAEQIELRELACTMLASIVFGTFAVFVQIGDGAIVVLGERGYETVFWPQSGEYLNTTNFLTDAEYAKKLEVRIVDSRVDEFAMFTDGLERLALRVNDRAAHEPFFRPLFQSLRAATQPDDYLQPLRQFLTSQRVNDRTDDDKTLILATRRTT
jgi:hypothetical protein